MADNKNVNSYNKSVDISPPFESKTICLSFGAQNISSKQTVRRLAFNEWFMNRFNQILVNIFKML